MKQFIIYRKQILLYICCILLYIGVKNLKVVSSISSFTASIRNGNYERNSGGGSSSDTYWIDLMSIVEVAANDPRFSELRMILDETELGFKLEQSRHITFFMPTNQAIQNELKPFLNYLTYTELVELFFNHVIPDVIKISELEGTRFEYNTMIDNSSIIIEPVESRPKQVRVFIKDNSQHVARIQGMEINTANGASYAIDHILLSASMKKKFDLLREKMISSDTNNVNLPSAPAYIATTNMSHRAYGRYEGNQKPTVSQDSNTTFSPSKESIDSLSYHFRSSVGQSRASRGVLSQQSAGS